MTLGEFRKATKDLPDDKPIMYHGYDKGCGHFEYASFGAPSRDGWCYISAKHKDIVLNPGDDYDPRKMLKK